MPDETRQSPSTSPPDSLADQLREAAELWARSQHQLVVLSAAFADSDEWLAADAPTAAHWLAAVADVEACTAREWIRIGRKLQRLPATAAAFASGRLSYSKVRALTRLTDVENEAELVALAQEVPAGRLRRELARWLTANTDAEELAQRQRKQRSVTWRNEPDGMVVFTLRLEPLVAGKLSTTLKKAIVHFKPRRSVDDNAPADAWATIAQQRADALAMLLDGGLGPLETEVVIHVRGDGCTLDDGTPIAESVVERIAPNSFIRALVHDSAGRPVNASSRRRHPTTRQKRVVTERDRSCVDCGGTDLIHFDHTPEFEQSRRTVIDELELRCAPCHRKRHRSG